MIQQLKLAAFVLLIGLAVVLLLAVTSDYASGSDYTVTRTTTIQSQRPIGLLALELGWGVLNGRDSTDGIRLNGVAIDSTTLSIDGRPAPGIGGVASAVWRLVGFVVWDEAGRIERVTDLQFRGRSVRIVDAVEDGRVWVRVTVGPPLGDPRVRCAVLELSVVEDDEHGALLARWLRADTTLRLSCSAVIDLPGDLCRLVRRLAQRIAERDGGPELRGRVDGLAAAGRNAVMAGRGRLVDSVVAEFLERVCR